MSKLWQKDFAGIDKKIEKFTVGNDFVLDQSLVIYDCISSLAHATMLKKIGILKEKELNDLKKGLIEIINAAENNRFEINPGDEDCHTAIENYLTSNYGEIGKKIHTGRSRNDQVLTAIRLYEKDKLIEIALKVITAAQTCINFASKNEFIPMPGYTHFQRAMPSSIGLLFSAYAESLIDDFILLDSVLNLINQSPLGSAAGYGVAIPLDRAFTAKLLGFGNVQKNVLYAQNSRGKFELSILHSFSNLLLTINKIASDFILFNTKEFGFFLLPKELTTGSSIMAQKQNPDVFELLRSKSNLISGYYSELNSIIRNLPSGYHRDFQLTKEPLIRSINLVNDILDIFIYCIDKIIINKDRCREALSPEIFAADSANQMVMKGIPFRDAYKNSENRAQEVKFDPIKNIKNKKHIGATGNLDIPESKKKIKSLENSILKKQKDLRKAINLLIG
jgi:argininosuccinate lyase